MGLNSTSDVHKPEWVTYNVDAVWTGTFHSMILKSDGSLWATGYNQYGQLGLGDTTDRYTLTEVKDVTGDVTDVSGGNYHTMILKSDDSLWATGTNSRGQLGFVTTETFVSTPVSVVPLISD